MKYEQETMYIKTKGKPVKQMNLTFTGCKPLVERLEQVCQTGHFNSWRLERSRPNPQ